MPNGTGRANIDIISPRRQADDVPDAMPSHDVHADRIAPDGLPELMRHYATRAIPSVGPIPTHVRVEQFGDMWRSPGGKPMHFRGVEEFTVAHVGFSWRAQVPIVPFVAMTIHDGIAAGQGWMRGRLCGVPVMNKTGPDLTAAAAMRYLAEIPWVPHAILANHEITWRQVVPHTVEASVRQGSESAAVMFSFDSAGDIVHVYADSRPRDGDIPRPWGGFFGDFAVIDGIRIPTTASVCWELPEGRFTYWQGMITSLELISRDERS